MYRSFGNAVCRGALAAVVSFGLALPAIAQYAGSSAQPVTRGGSGRADLTQNNLIFGNGTAPVGFIDPTQQAGKCLVSNGEIWVPSACIGVSNVIGTAPITANTVAGVTTLGLALSSNFAVASNALALANVFSTPGTVGSSTSIPMLTINSKGQVTAAQTAAPVVAAGNIAGLINLNTQVNGTLQAGNLPALSGDISTAQGSSATTLATVNATPGTAGSSSVVPIITTNGKGLVTSVSSASTSVAAGNISGPINLSTQVSNTLQAAQFPALTGDVTTTAGSLAATIPASAVTFAKIQNLAALSVFGNCTGASSAGGNVTGTANQVLRVNGAGTSCGFGAIDLSQAAAATGTLQTASMPAHTGDVTNTAGSLALSIGAGKVTNAMLAGGIASSKLVGADIATVGTVTAGTWNATTIGLTYGGTGANLSATGGTGQYVKQATLGGAFSVGTIAAADLPIATTGAFGAVKPDGTTITISGGVITASGASATAVTVGTTLVGSSTSGHLLYNNAGTLGGQTIVSALGSRATLPTKQKFLSGSGTYTTPANVLRIEVRMIGGGGGGGSATGSTSDDDYFIGTPGGTGQQAAAGSVGGAGGSSCGGGGGFAGSGGVNPGAASTNAGAGGGGGYQATSGTPSSGGGGSGGCVFATVNSPSATYSYAVGAGGTGGTSTGGQAGGAGAAGRILVIEHYN